jgi:hypothetical protein
VSDRLLMNDDDDDDDVNFTEICNCLLHNGV